jgi:hypothetical protein
MTPLVRLACGTGRAAALAACATPVASAAAVIPATATLA